MGGILWLYQTQGLFKICAPDTYVTEDSHVDCILVVGLKKTKQKKKTLSFNLVKVQILILIS